MMSQIIKMGKYRGKTLEYVSKDINYTKWLLSQSWFKERYDLLYDELNKLNNTRSPIIKDNEDIVIYTDGACINNGINGKDILGGIGIYYNRRNKIDMEDISDRLKNVYRSVGINNYDNTIDTNNKAELMAICVALDRCKRLERNIKIYTDSEYSINAITKWYPSWVSKNVLEKKKNYELIDKINNYISDDMRDIKVEFIHIRSHTGLKDEHSLGNSEADKLAYEGALKK